MTTITTFAVASNDGKITVKDAMVSVELRKGLGLAINGIGDFPARELMLRVLNALSASGCVVGKRQIILDFDFGNITPQHRASINYELLDFPVAVALMNELGFAKFDTSMRLRYVGMLCPDGRIELLGDSSYIACHDRVFMGRELVCANTIWDELKVDPGHVYLSQFRKAFNQTEELTKVQTRGTVVSYEVDEVHGVCRCRFQLRTTKGEGMNEADGGSNVNEVHGGSNEGDGILSCTMMNEGDGGCSLERMAPGVMVSIEGRATKGGVLVQKLEYL